MEGRREGRSKKGGREGKEQSKGRGCDLPPTEPPQTEAITHRGHWGIEKSNSTFQTSLPGSHRASPTVHRLYF